MHLQLIGAGVEGTKAGDEHPLTLLVGQVGGGEDIADELTADRLLYP